MGNEAFGRDTNEAVGLLMDLLLTGTAISTPTEFHDKYTAVAKIIDSDTSGLVSSLTDFQVESAITDIVIDTPYESLNEILNDEWLTKLNKKYRGQGIKSGIQGLMEEYYREIWQGASFPLFKITDWEEINGIMLPTGIVIANGGSIYCKDDADAKPFPYKYFIGEGKDEEEIEKDACFLYKYGCRWWKKYPSPFLIKRGIYKHWVIIDEIKNKQGTVLNQVIPYLLRIKRGSEGLEVQGNKTFGTPEMKDVKEKIQDLMDKVQRLSQYKKEVPMRVSNWDEVWEDYIPNLENMFKDQLFASAEKGILAGLGFIDIADAVSSSRRESILNPKVFIKECNTGVKGFNTFMTELCELIREKNKEHAKYSGGKWIVHSKKITEFNTPEFLDLVRSLSDRGRLSNETEHELIGINHELEYRRSVREATKSEDVVFLPKLIQNQEQHEPNFRSELNIPKNKTPEEITKEHVPEDRKADPDKKNFTQASKKHPCECVKCGWKTSSEKHCKDIKCAKCGGQMRRSDRPGLGKGELTTAPYVSLKDVPDAVKKLSIEKQRTWLGAFNGAYKFYYKKLKNKYKDREKLLKEVDRRAFSTAWSKV